MALQENLLAGSLRLPPATTMRKTRPIYFFVTFWGERYRRYFSDILLRSLLAPRNLPLLSREDAHKFLVCCPNDDWMELQRHPTIDVVSTHIEIAHVPTPPSPSGRHPVDHMAVGHLMATSVCFEAKAYGSLLHPDMVFADGFVACLLRHIDRGTQVLLAPALRLKDRPLFALLGLDSPSYGAEPIVLSPERVVAASIESLHDEIVECELNGPRFSTLPNSVWWHNNDAGLLLHSFTWSPLLIDYGSIPRHEVDDLCGPLPDGDYISRNFLPESRICFVDDSDEMVFASWTPAALGAREHGRSVIQALPVVGRLLRHSLLRRAYLHYTRDFYPKGDHIKLNGFWIPLKLRSARMGDWQVIAATSQDEIVRAIGDIASPPLGPPTAWTRTLDRIIPWLGLYERSLWLVGSARFILRRLAAALHGDRAARAWIVTRVRARLGG
jgi:hypothetical protein